MASYDDFEPFCQWRRGQGRDVLEVHLQGFIKENMRVQINNCGVLTITGERPIDDAKISRFRKEIKVSTDLSAEQIRAKFVKGILYLTLEYDKSQVKELSEKSSQKNKKTNNDNECTQSCSRDGILSSGSSKRMALSLGVVVALGIVVGGFLMTWKYSNVPDSVVY